MAKVSSPPLPTADLVFALREIIAALDRRVPQIARAGEVAIAHDALVLRAEAIDRLHELQPGGADGYDEDLVLAILTDDGG